jgi:hypothetical protein
MDQENPEEQMLARPFVEGRDLINIQPGQVTMVGRNA